MNVGKERDGWDRQSKRASRASVLSPSGLAGISNVAWLHCCSQLVCRRQEITLLWENLVSWTFLNTVIFQEYCTKCSTVWLLMMSALQCGNLGYVCCIEGTLEEGLCKWNNTRSLNYLPSLLCHISLSALFPLPSQSKWIKCFVDQKHWSIRVRQCSWTIYACWV